MEDNNKNNVELDENKVNPTDDLTRGSENSEEEINFILIEEKTEDTKKVLADEDFQNKLHREEYLKSKPVYHDDDKIVIKKKSISRFIAAVLIIAIMGGFTAGAGYRIVDYMINGPESSVKYIPEFTQTSLGSNKRPETTVTQIAKKLEPSVVAITNQIVQESFFGQQTGTSSGSGVIFDISTDKVYILTNHHVIDGSNEISVNFFGNQSYNAKLVGSDKDTDLAVITVDITSMNQEVLNKVRPIELGDSDDIHVGETAIAIGNPLGYNNTVTVGIISALDRTISEDLNALSLIQTDAAINPGNSGGALVDDEGKLIGINTVKISDTAVEGIGFAIPINSAIPVLEEIIEKGYVSKPFIGIYGSDVTKELSDMYKVPVGVMIQDTIPNSPAQKFGLEKFDIITSINDEEVATMSDLNRIIRDYGIGDKIKITIQREINDKFELRVIELVIGDRYDY
jgi:serine protease Do